MSLTNKAEESDAELVRKTQSGNKEAYGELVARYQGRVYGFAHSLVNNWADAQDIAQETFIRAYCNLDQLRDSVRFPAWLRRVTFSVAMNWLKASRSGIFEQFGSLEDLDSLGVPDLAPGPQEIVEKRELADVVLRAVASLPPKYRIPLTMFYLNGLSYQQVADFLEVPIGTAKSLIHRARQKLKPALSAYAPKEVSSMVQEVLNENKLPAEFSDEVMSTIQAMFEAIEEKDMDKLAEHYSQEDDLTAFLPTIPFRVDGYQQFWQGIQDYQGKKTSSRVQIFQPKIQIYGDVAVCTFYSTTRIYAPADSTQPGESPSPKTHSARTTQVFHKRDGKWVLVHTHISALP